jgi:hypothetical protein
MDPQLSCKLFVFREGEVGKAMDLAPKNWHRSTHTTTQSPYLVGGAPGCHLIHMYQQTEGCICAGANIKTVQV